MHWVESIIQGKFTTAEYQILIEKMLIIGELINSTRKPIERALIDQDEAYLRQIARLQAENGAAVIDLNAATSLIRKREVEDTQWLVDIVQDELEEDFPEVRLCIDTPNPEAMVAGLQRCRKRPFLNSVTNERNRQAMFDAMLGKDVGCMQYVIYKKQQMKAEKISREKAKE